MGSKGQVLFRDRHHEGAAPPANSLRQSRLGRGAVLRARLTGWKMWRAERFGNSRAAGDKAHRPPRSERGSPIQRRILDEHAAQLELGGRAGGLGRAESGRPQRPFTARERPPSPQPACKLASIGEQIGIVSGAEERGYYPRNKACVSDEAGRGRARLEARSAGTRARLHGSSEKPSLGGDSRILQAAQRMRDDAGRELADVGAADPPVFNEQIEVPKTHLTAFGGSGAEGGHHPRRSNGEVPRRRDPGRGEHAPESLVPGRRLLSHGPKVSPLDVQNVGRRPEGPDRFTGASYTRKHAPLYGPCRDWVRRCGLGRKLQRKTLFLRTHHSSIAAGAWPTRSPRRLCPEWPPMCGSSRAERTVPAYFLGPIRDPTLAKAIARELSGSTGR